MHANYAVLTGTRHQAIARPCQDYALAGEGANVQDEAWCWAVISDGCSSAGHTDIGARAWVMAAGALLSIQHPRFLNWRSDEVINEFLNATMPWRSLLQMNDLYATMGVVAATETDAWAALFGDGAVVAKYADGRMRLMEVEYSGNAPEYLAYYMDDALRNQWCEAHGGYRRIRDTLYAADGEILRRNEYAAQHVFSFDRRLVPLETIAVVSDGIASCPNGDVYTIAREMMAVKSASGAFAQRRIGSLGRLWAKQGQLPHDDLSMGAIWLGDKP